MSANHRRTLLGVLVALALTLGSAVLVGTSASAARASGKKFTVSSTAKKSVEARKKFTLKGKVRPAAPRAKVKLQRKRANGTWKTVQRDRLSSTSRYAFRVSAGRAGTAVTVRVVKLRTRTKARVVSRVRTVRVVAPRTTSTATATSTAPSSAVLAKEARVLALTNALRATGATCGGTWMPPAAPLSPDERLADVARAHAADMVNRGYLTHDSPEGVTPWTRMVAGGYRYSRAAENIAGGYPTPEAAVAGWTASAGHCRNMMNPDLDDLGVGFAASADGRDARWVQVFGTPL